MGPMNGGDRASLRSLPFRVPERTGDAGDAQVATADTDWVRQLEITFAGWQKSLHSRPRLLGRSCSTARHSGFTP